MPLPCACRNGLRVASRLAANDGVMFARHWIEDCRLASRSKVRRPRSRFSCCYSNKVKWIFMTSVMYSYSLVLVDIICYNLNWVWYTLLLTSGMFNVLPSYGQVQILKQICISTGYIVILFQWSVLSLTLREWYYFWNSCAEKLWET